MSVEISANFSVATRDWGWQQAAACRDMDVEVFFGVTDEASTRRRRREAQARAVCGRCPVQRPCLLFAIKHNIRDGIWGGTPEDERAALARKLRQASLTP